MNPISPKVSVGAGAAAGSTPLSIVIVWALSLFHVTVPPEVAVSISALLAAGSSLLAGYYAPHVGDVPPPVPPITTTATGAPTP